jgi:HlyD family secretion protein
MKGSGPREPRQIEGKRLEFRAELIEPQIAAKQAAVDQAKANAALKKDQMEQLKVRKPDDGVLQQLPVKLVSGQAWRRTSPASPIRPSSRRRSRSRKRRRRTFRSTQKAIDRYAERRGRRPRHRVDPAVEQGTVTVDVAIDGDLPKGARPDLSVDGTIELERLDNVIYVGRPAFGQENNTVGIFKLVAGTSEAVRTPVKLGRSSVNTIEIISGLEPGDQVILSDTSSMDRTIAFA